tara:strand:- start:40 stop:213 length:174 start_codon:yes stop_codon:yes gene_type:complete
MTNHIIALLGAYAVILIIALLYLATSISSVASLAEISDISEIMCEDIQSDTEFALHH